LEKKLRLGWPCVLEFRSRRLEGLWAIDGL
jgi:hypothetical protein